MTGRYDVLLMFSMSTRARSPLKRNAERKFPIRVRIKAPEGGQALEVDAIYEWLRQEVGQGNYAWTSDSQPGFDASAVYLPSVEIAYRLVAEFDLELLYIEDMKLV